EEYRGKCESERWRSKIKAFFTFFSSPTETIQASLGEILSSRLITEPMTLCYPFLAESEKTLSDHSVQLSNTTPGDSSGRNIVGVDERKNEENN
ncbi:hypothetical protein PFISCL1PPCAC_2027, partial [Pristionchus fissidentatus]